MNTPTVTPAQMGILALIVANGYAIRTHDFGAFVRKGEVNHPFGASDLLALEACGLVAPALHLTGPRWVPTALGRACAGMAL